MSTGTEEGLGGHLLTLADDGGVPDGAAGVPALAWISGNGIEVRFESRLGEASDTPALTIAAGGEGKSGIQIAGAGDAIAVAWQEISSSGQGVIKLCGVSREAGVLGTEITVGGPASGASHHSLFISGYSQSSTPAGSGLSGVNLVWVASDPTDAAGVGRIMLQRFGVAHDDSGTPSELVPLHLPSQIGNGTLDRIASVAGIEAALTNPANDNAMWVGDAGSGGAVGSVPTVATLDTGDVLVAWVGSEGHVHGKLYALPGPDGSPLRDYTAVNEALADLPPQYGRDGEGHSQDARRVKIAELGPGNFALVWIVAAGADAMLNGTLFMLQGGEAFAGEPGGQWTQTPVAPVTLPQGFTGEFNVVAADVADGGLAVAYEVADAAGGVSARMVVQKIATPDLVLDGHDESPAAELPAAKAHIAGHTGNSFVALAEHASIEVNAQPLQPAEPVAETPAPEPAPQEIPPPEAVVTANADGVAVAWTVTGRTADTVGIRLRLHNSEISPSDGDGSTDAAAVIEVTDCADPDIPPAVVRTGGGGAVAAWVDGESGELRAQSYTSHGEPQASGNGISVSSPGHTVSDVALASHSSQPAANGEDGSADEDEVAVAWVQDADEDGYGSIMLQRYSLPDPEDSLDGDCTPVALGRDGQDDGQDDPGQFTVDGESGPEPAVGRAPQVVDLDQGQIALSWVASEGSQETVRGAVIERAGGREVLNFDLSDHLDEPAIVAKGTKPILSSSPNGDILVTWLSPDGDGGYDAKAALYRSTGPGTWSLPESVIDLQHFGSEPDDFSVSLTSDSQIFMTWESDSGSNMLGRYFDLGGEPAGETFRIRGKDGSGSAALDAAALPDGKIVVVYAEKDKRGDIDIESHVVKTEGAGLANLVDASQTAASDAASHIFPDVAVLDQDAGLGDYGSLDGAAPLALDKDITVAEDATDGVIIDVLNDSEDAGLRVVQVNGEDLAIGAPLRVEHGFVQLRTDGDLLFTADEDFRGTINFEYTISNDGDRISTASVSINVTPVEDDPMLVDLDLDPASDIASLEYVAPALDGSGQGESEGSGGSASAGEDIASDAGDTIALAPQYASEDSRTDHVERQWLQLDSHDGDATQDNDTFVFHAAFGNDAAPEHRGADQVIDLSNSGYPTFEALQQAGALVQVGADVEIVLNGDAANPEKILLRSVDLSTLTANDFKFS